MTFVPIEPINNLLLIGIKPIQLIQSTNVYIFLETSITYAQHESLKKIIIFFEQIALVA